MSQGIAFTFTAMNCHSSVLDNETRVIKRSASDFFYHICECVDS